jgi:hypothetical protein
MKNKINQIRELLDKLEKETPSEDEEALLRDFSAFELPGIIQDVVDFLIPLLTPFESTIYFHMFRHSIIADGTQYVRISNTILQTNVVKPLYDSAKEISRPKVVNALNSLQELGAIRKEGEPNREGTLYRVMIPEEIEECKKLMRTRKQEERKTVDIEKEVDYYNVKENRFKIFERDNYDCKYCSKKLTRFTATLDHIKPVSEGGDNSYDNLVTACLNCNSQKNRKLLGDFLADTTRQSKST